MTAGARESTSLLVSLGVAVSFGVGAPRASKSIASHQTKKPDLEGPGSLRATRIDYLLRNSNKAGDESAPLSSSTKMSWHTLPLVLGVFQLSFRSPAVIDATARRLQYGIQQKLFCPPKVASTKVRGGQFMRAYAFAIAAAAFVTCPASAFSQGVEIGPKGIQIQPQQQGRSVEKQDCDELRRACLHKDELGEQGDGNCRRYRSLCRSR